MGLQVGQYEMRVMKEGYQEYNETIDIVGEKPNCILVELDAIPYEVKFTVLDSENDMVIPNATVSINESTYLTDEHGVVIVSLPNGTFTYTVFRSGYMSYSDFIVVDDAPISKIIKLNKAFYTLKLIVRDIENGNYIQGAELNINEETKITNINGVATVTLGNGTYDYVVTQRNYKRYTGQVVIKDQDVVETIYLELRDTVITYTATDAITKDPIPEVNITLINKGTGITVDSGYTNDIGVLQLGAEAGEYTWNATHRYYNTVADQAITLEKLKDIDLPFIMTRREIEPEVDVIENIPGVSGDATTVRFSGENTAETLSNDSYYYIVHTPENFVVPNKGVTFDLMEHVKTFRRAEIGGEDEPYDFTSGGAELKFNISNDEIASLEGTMLTVQPNVTRDAEPRAFYVDVTITTPVSQVTVKITAEQKAALNFNPVKAGIVVSVKNMYNDNVREYTTNAAGKIFPEVMPGIDYQLTIKEKGFYENEGLLIKNWGFGASVPTLMEITCSKKAELRVKQQNTLRPLENATIKVSGMSLPQTVTSGSDGSARVYISPIAMSYECTVTDHTKKTGTFTPPLSADYMDIIMGYAAMTFSLTLTASNPYSKAAESCPVTVTSAWGGTSSQSYSFSGTTNASGQLTSQGNGNFNIPPGNYTITYGGGNSNFDGKTENIYLPTDKTHSAVLTRRTKSVTFTVKEIIPSISTTVSNPVKTGLVLACYYNDNGTSSGVNVTTNASGQFTKTVYAGIAERFQVQPIGFYSGNGVIVTVNYKDANTKDLVYTCSKRIPVYITSNLYGELSGASVTFSGMSVNQTGTTNTDGIVQMYISPVNMSYSVSKQHYNTKTGNFKPTGTETRMDIELEAKEYPVTFHVSTQGVLPPDGILVRVTNNALPDIVFEGETNAEGTIVMPNVPVGEYIYEVLAGEVSSDTFSHPQSESGTVLDVEVQYELINAGIQVSEVYGAAGRAYLSNQTITMTSKAGTIKLTLDENGYTNQLLIKGLEYTFTTDSYPNFYSNPTQSYTWTEDGVIWPFNLNVTSKITVNVKDVYVKNNIQGVTVAYNEQVVTTDASGNASLFRSALTKDYSLDKNDYSTVNGTIAPTTASPLNVTMLRNKHVVTVKFVEGLSSSEIIGPIVNRISYSSDAGNGTFETNDEGIAQVSVYLNIPITFSILDNKSYYSVTTSTQSITFTESNTTKTIVAVMIQPINIKVVNDNDTTIVVDGAKVSYNGQIATTNADGVAALYRSGSNVDKNISVSANNYNIFNSVITTSTPSPYQVRLQFISVKSTLKVVEMIPDGKGGYIEGGLYANQKLQYRSGSFNYEVSTSDEGLYIFDRQSIAPIHFDVIGHPEFYENPENTFAYGDFFIDKVTVLQLKCSAKITINVKSNVPSGTNLSGATVKYFNQTATTDASGNVSLYRSSVTGTVTITATYCDNYSGSITSSSASPFNVVMTRSTATVSLGIREVVPVTPKYMIEITTDASSSVSPGLGGFSFGTSTSANREFVAYFRAKIPAGRKLTFASNATGDNPVRKWVASNDGNGTGGWYTYVYYVRCGATGSFSTTNYFYINGGSRPVTWYLEMATVFDITGSNVQNKSDAEILSKCTLDKIINSHKDFLFSESFNGVNMYNNSGTSAVTLTRKAASGTDTFNFTMGSYSSMKMNFSPAASTSPLTLDTNGNVSFVCYLGTPVTFTPVTRPNYYSNPNTALTYTAAGQVKMIYLVCNQKITLNTVANIYNTSNALSGTITYFGQTLPSGGSFYRSGLDRQMTATAQYFNNYVGTVTATQTSPYTVTMNRTTRTVTLIVRESVSGNEYTLSGAVMVRSVPTGSNAPAGEITLDTNGRKSNTVYAGINYTYTPKNNASYYSNASQTHTWTSENEQWIMTLNVTARLTFNIKSSNYGTNISGVSGSYFGQTGTTDSSGNWTVYRSGISRSYSFSKTNYNALSGTLSAAQASPLNLKMSETSSSITFTLKDYYQGAQKGNANGCPVTLVNKSIASIKFSGSTNASGQVSFGPMIAGTYTVSWGGGTSYWVASSGTITMPLAANTMNATRLTKSVGTYFRLKIPFSTPVLGWWGTANLVKPIFTTAGVATTVSLTANTQVYYLATYTWIAGITTNIAAYKAGYFVTGTTTTETTYNITPNYDFSNIGHNSDATAFYSTAIKSIVVTVQNSYTNAAVSGATINMYGLNGSYQTSGELGANHATQTVTTNSSGQATIYVSGLTNRYVVSATRYVTLNTTNTNTSNFTIKLVPSEVTITITVKDVNTGTSVGSGCIVKLSSNNTSTAYSGTTNSSGQVVLKIKPGNYWWEAGGSTTWGGNGTGDWNYPNRSTTSISLVKDQSITIEALKVGVWVEKDYMGQYTNTLHDNEYAYTGVTNNESDESKLLYPSNSFGWTFKSSILSSTGEWTQLALTFRQRNYYSGQSLNPLYVDKKPGYWDYDSTQPFDNPTTIVCNMSYTYENRLQYYILSSIMPSHGGIMISYFIFNDRSQSGNINFKRKNSIKYEIAFFQKVTTRIYNSYSLKKFTCNVATVVASNGVIVSLYISAAQNYFFNTILMSTNTDSAIQGEIDFSSVKDYPFSQLHNLLCWNKITSEAVDVTHTDYLFLVKMIPESYNQYYNNFDYLFFKAKNILNNYPNAGSASNWECYYNIPSAVKSVIGGDCWVSPDLKWLFYIKNNSTAIGGYTKGLHAIKGSSALFNMTGWSGTSYTMDKEGSAIAEDCKNIYILDIKFNSKSNRMMIFGNSTRGHFGNFDLGSDLRYIEGTQPDVIYFFALSTEWVNVTKTVSANTDFPSTYLNAGKQGSVYLPNINFVNNSISYMYPAGNKPITGYRYNLIWDN